MTGPGDDQRATEPDSLTLATPDPAPDSPGSPDPVDAAGPGNDLPGGSIFTLEGRRAPGLYLVAWLLTVFGLAVTFLLGPMASDPTIRPVIISIGALMVTVGFAAAAGSQVLERQDRDPERYRGPSPLLVFGAYYFAVSAVGVVMVGLLGVVPDRPFSFLGIGVVQAAGYVLVVWLFAVRTDALSWRQMGWPTWDGARLRAVLQGIGTGMAVMLPVTFGMVVVGTIVGLLLGVDAPSVLPLSETPIDGLMVYLAAAVIIPVGEELFFRGFALTAWLRDLGPRSALIRSSLFFALIHTLNIAGVDFATGVSQAVLQFAVLLPVAFVLGWLFIRHGMAGAIAGHVTYNSLLLALAFLASKIPDPV